MIKRLLKWTPLVWFNSIISFTFGLMVYGMDAPSVKGLSQNMFILGMVAGIFTFVFIYTFIDYKAHQTNKIHICQSLMHSVIIKGVLQFTLIFEFYLGALALTITDRIIEVFGFTTQDSFFLFSYLSTVITGFLLSIPVGLLTYLLSLRKKYK